jgi:hypothetical protein
MIFEELMDSTPPMQQHALVKGYQVGFAAGVSSRDAEIQRLQFALADTEALELGTAERCDQLREHVKLLREVVNDALSGMGGGYAIWSPRAQEALAATEPIDNESTTISNS